MNTLKNKFNEQLKRVGKDIIINGSSDTKAIFKEIKDTTSSKDNKYLIAEIGLIKQGDIVTYNNVDYLVMLENENTNNVYTQYTITRIKYNKVKLNFQGEIVEVPVLIETGQQDIEQNQYISIIDGKIKLTMQENKVNDKVKEDFRLIVMGYVWKVISKTKEDKGLIYVYVEKDVFNTQYDDRENEIADRWRYESKHSYNMSVEPTETTLNEGDTIQINVTVTDTVNNIISPVENPTLLYISSEDTIATVDNTGLITAILEGMAIITVKFITDGVELIKNINITITKEEITHTYSISGSDSITWTVTQTYKIVDEGGNISTDRYFFSIDNSQLASLTTVDDQTCKIQGNSNQLKGDIVLQATSLSTYEVLEKAINIKGFW